MSVYATLNSTKPIPMAIRDSTVRFQTFGQRDNYDAPIPVYYKKGRRKSSSSPPDGINVGKSDFQFACLLIFMLKSELLSLSCVMFPKYPACQVRKVFRSPQTIVIIDITNIIPIQMITQIAFTQTIMRDRISILKVSCSFHC